MQVREIAAPLQAPFEGSGNLNITGAAALETATTSDLSFAAGPALGKAATSPAGCVLVPLDYQNTSGRTIIRVPQPRAAFAQIISKLYPPEPLSPGIHPTAVIAPTSTIHSECQIGPHVTIGDKSNIKAGTRIASGSNIGSNVVIGEHCTVYPNVSIYPGVEIGNRVILHSGCVLGADGFGFVLAQDHYEKFPQIGRVKIGDDVEIGANSCVDRAALGVTEIGDGTKIDNMVHIGHNCRLGKHVVIAAQTGLSGGVVVEDYAVIGGQVGIGDKARIESRAVLGSGSGILTSKIVRAGEPVWGTPARPLRQHLEQLANITRLPALREEVKALAKRLEELERER